MMRRIFIVLAAIFALSGCATSTQYGSFVHIADPGQLAADAVQQLTAMHAPAHTRLVLRQPTTDTFGQALTQALREKGYRSESVV